MYRFYRPDRYDVVEEPISDTLELPTLGRSMRVGTLYDCRRYEVITPYKDNAPVQRKLLEQKGTKINIIRSDSFNDKSVALGLDASLKASVLVDLVQVDAGAKYIHDRQPQDSQCRITLHIQKTTKLEFVTLETLEASLKGKTPDVFTQGRATHVVSSALYGSNTFIVLDYCGCEEKENAAKVLNDLVYKIEVCVKEGEGTPTVDGDQYVQCRVYSDLTPECNPTNIEGLLTFMTALPEIAEEKLLPIKVFLYPLSKIDTRSARVFSIVGDSVTAQVHTFLEGLEDCLIRSHELASDPICKDFPQMKEKIELFKRLLTEYRSNYKKEIGRLLPLILGGSDGEGCIREMFRDVHSSPFNLTSMKAWVQSKRKEMIAIKRYVSFLPEVEIVNSHETLYDILLDPSIEKVVCFTFRLKGAEEGYLRVLSEYIAPERQISSYKDVHWYDDMALMKEMRLRAKLFSGFFESNKETGCTRFIKTGFKHDQSGSSEGESGRIGGAVNLFEEGMLTQEDFQPPSQPLKPQCTINDQHSVTLTWTPPEHGTSNVQSYTVKYKVFRGQRDQPEHHEMQTKSLETSVTVDNLKPNQNIQFQVIAVCSAGVSAESERSPVATTLSAQSPEKPEFRNVTDSSVILKWRQPGKMGKDEVIASYVIELMEADEITEIDTESSKKEFKIKKLEPNTTYTFQVVAVYESGIESPRSAVSDICTTLPASQPGEPTVGDVKSSSAVITWTDPTNVGRGVELYDYFIEYRKETNHQESTKSTESPWEKVVLRENGTANKCCLVSGLDPNMTYVARVTLVCLVDNGKTSVMIPSVISDHFTTLPAGPPIDLKARQVSASHIEISWTKPAVAGINTELMHYEIQHSTENGSGRVKTETGDSSCEFVISSVQPGTRYTIQVFGFYGKAGKGEGGTVHIKTRLLLKNDVIHHSKVLDDGCKKTGKPQVLRLPLRKVCEKPHSRSYSFGVKPKIEREHKVIMVVGVTGAGKSTLINAMVNDILEVEWKDYYRFKVVDVNEGNGANQAYGQTQVLTSYTLMDENLYLPYTLTIIDTPGFGDTRGIHRDKEIFDQIREFFLDAESHGIDHIDAIGFVVQASQARLTPTQKYVFDAILSVFGKDIAENILLLVTFADGSDPPVMDAVNEAKIPFTGKMYKFNNSAIFAATEVRPNRQNGRKTANKTGLGKTDTSLMYWNMGSQNLKDFFQKVQTLTARSLVLTKEVLEERKHLEVTVQGLQPQIMVGNCKYEALRKEQHILEEHEVQIEANKDFKFTLMVPKSKKIDITGKYITNCTKCHFTCHYPCHIADDAKKAKCSAMRGGVCKVCPGKCAWDVHFNQQYRFEYYDEEEEKTYEEIEARYIDASGKKLTVQQVIQEHLKSLTKVRTDVFALIAEAHKSVTRLEEIALKPNPLSTVEYIDLLIEAEKRSGKPGWQDRVNGLEDVRKEADITGKVKQANYNPFEKLEANITIKVDNKRGWFSWLRK